MFTHKKTVALATVDIESKHTGESKLSPHGYRDQTCSASEGLLGRQRWAVAITGSRTLTTKTLGKHSS